MADIPSPVSPASTSQETVLMSQGARDANQSLESYRDYLMMVARGKIGVSSGDSVENHQMFKDVWDLNFTLLADEEAKVAEQFGVPARIRTARALARGTDGKPLETEDGERLMLERKATFRRWTYILNDEGEVVYKNMQVNPAKDSEEVLKFVQKQNANEED